MKIAKIFDLSQMKGTIYFMSDLHYNHRNILTMNDKRSEFECIENMNKYILEELKTKLTPEDILFDLGDMVWKSEAHELIKIIDSIPTKNFYKLWGNHDNFNLFKSVEDKFTLLTDYIDIQIKDQEGEQYQVSLFHYPIEDFNHMFHGGLHLFGHVHGSLDKEYATGNNPRLMADVGFDSALAKKAGSFLIPIETVIDWFKEKTDGDNFVHWARNNYKYD